MHEIMSVNCKFKIVVFWDVVPSSQFDGYSEGGGSKFL